MDLDEDIQISFTEMSLLDDIRNGKPLHYLMVVYPFMIIYTLVKHISIDLKYGLSVDLHNNSDKIYDDIITNYPIEKFPEKYI